MAKKASFEILGVSPDASEKEIKRAYFKLIREHSPEEDPEGFKEIRMAYEMMMAPQKDEEKPPFDVDDEKAVIIKARMEEILQNRKWKDAVKEAEAAIVIWPNSSYFKYLLIRAYRGNGNTTKAVRMAEQLCAEEPDNKFFAREYTMSCFARGFFVKASAGFKKAYELGVRDFDFLMAGIESQNVSRNNPFSVFFHSSQYREILDLFSDDEDHLVDIVSIYEAVLKSYNINLFFGRDCPSEINQDGNNALDFLQKHDLNKIMDAEGQYVLYAVVNAFSSFANAVDSRLLFKLDETIERFKDVVEEKYYAKMKEVTLSIEEDKVENDKKVSKYIERLSFARIKENYDDEGLREYAIVDKKLCILKKSDKIFSSLQYVKETYPLLWKHYEDFFHALYDNDKANKLMDELRAKYRNIASDYTGGLFYQEFPDEKRRALEFYGIKRESKYSRPLVGRNHPCPCGSGKKFKKCCMGKRIFD